MKIRPFQKSDAEELTKMIHAVIRISNSKDYGQKAIKALIKSFDPASIIRSAGRKIIFVVTEKNRLIATAGLKKNRLSAFFVLPQYQGKGIGTKLLKHIEKLARQKGMKKLRVRSSITAFEFYRKNGYQKTRRATHQLIGPIVWLKKELK